MAIYRDGIQEAYAATHSTFSRVNSDLYVGGFSLGALAGTIDDMKIYNYARTPAQIVQDMNANHPAGNAVSATAYYKFDEGSGSTTHNSGSQGSGLNGSFVGSPTWSNNGRVNRALYFGGSNSTYIAVNSLGSTDPLDIARGYDH